MPITYKPLSRNFIYLYVYSRTYYDYGLNPNIIPYYIYMRDK